METRTVYQEARITVTGEPYRRGRDPGTGRPVRGYRLRCAACLWRGATAGALESAHTVAAAHIREAHR